MVKLRNILKENDGIVQKMNVNNTTKPFRKKHLLNSHNVSYYGGLSPEDVLLDRYDNDWNHPDKNSMISWNAFGDMENGAPNEERVIWADTWHIRAGSNGAEAVPDVPQETRLCFNSYGHACLMDELVGAVRK